MRSWICYSNHIYRDIWCTYLSRHHGLSILNTYKKEEQKALQVYENSIQLQDILGGKGQSINNLKLY
jgi:hypothetical protein